MKADRLALRALLSCALATSAGAQVHQIAFEWDASQPTEKEAVDTCIAASPDRVIVASNQVLALFERNGDPIVSIDVRVGTGTGTTNPDFIFDDSVGYIDPRVEYDPYSGRFWLLYLAGDGFHLAISESSQPEGFEPAGTVPTGEGWHIYTGADRFDPTSGSIPAAHRFHLWADHPAISFDSEYMYLVAVDIHRPGFPFPTENLDIDAILIFPRTHDGGTKSILEGERPADSDIEGLQLRDLESLFQLPNDEVQFHYPVQEPFEEIEEGQFFIATTYGPRFGDPAGSMQPPRGVWNDVHDQIRLGGLYRNPTTGEWEYIFRDLDLPSTSDYFYNPTQPVGSDDALPATPAGDSTWVIRTLSTKFDSASICRDVNNELKIFAANHVVAADSSGQPIAPFDRHEFRWYVIDPDLSNFPGSNWNPQIEVVGSAPTGGVTNAETYEGAIAVNADGIAYITFTRSGTGNNGWPSLVRARLSNNYTTTLFEQSGQAGPEQAYDNGSTSPRRELGTDYCDIQSDYDHCGFWAVGTIAAQNPGSPLPPETSARAVWLTEIYACNSFAEMNGDGTVDAADLAAFLEYHAKEDPRADMDRSGTIDAADYLIYTDAYARR